MKRYLALVLSVSVLLGCLALAACGARASSAAIGHHTAADPVLFGDANGDGDRDMKDVLTIRLYIAGLTSEINLAAADVNRDGDINMKDVLQARRCIAGLEAWITPDVSDVVSDPVASEAQSEEPSEELSEAVSEEPSEAVSEESSEPLDDTIIYDADVNVTLTLSPGKTYSNADIAWAFERELMTYGVAEYYTLTVQMEAEADDLIYPIMLGGNDAAEAWPVSEIDRSFRIEGSGTIFGSLAGSVFDNAQTTPRQLFFYSEKGTNTVTLRHIRIQVIRRVSEPTTTTPPTVATTQPTAAPTIPSDLTRPIGTDDYTVVDGVPIITFRRYGDEGTLGVWWWGTADALNEETCETYLDFLYQNGVDEIFFYGYYWCERQKEDLHTFVQKANVRGMVVSLLYDDADAIAGRQNLAMTRIANNYLNYCAAYPTDQLSGIHFDVEGVSRENMVNYMISQFPEARARGVKIAMDIACGWRDEITYNGVTGIYNIIAANVDTMSLMSYRDKAERVWSFGANAFAAAKTYGTKITFGVETGDSHEGNSVDFSAESKREVATELAKVYRMLVDDHPTGGYGLTIHHVQSWYALRNE